MNEQWFTAVGAWGDSLCAYGQMHKHLKGDKANVVVFSLDQNICRFFKAQPNVNRVEWLKIEPPPLFAKYAALAHDDFPRWVKETGLGDQLPELTPTHFHAEPYRDFDAALPPCMAEWEQFLEPSKPYVLFQPYSTQSCGYEGHWPHWMDALTALIDHDERDIVVVGEMTPDFEKWYDLDLMEHPKVRNLVGQTQSMIDVLHILNWADQYVGTCNALAYWSLIKKKPALVACNNIIKPATPYYYNWLNHGTVKLLDHDASLDALISSFDCSVQTA